MNIDVTKPKYFQFNVNIDGIDYHTLKGKLEFIYEGVSYGFPTKIYKDRVEVEIPALQNVIKKRISESDEMKCILEITGDGFHLEPWKSNITIERSAYVDTANPIIEDIGEKDLGILKDSENIVKNKKFLLDEDIKYLQKLKHQLKNQDNQFQNKSSSKQILQEQPIQNKKTSKKVKFDKKQFILEISKIEENAVKNNIPLSETSKNDNDEQLRIRKKVRKIFQEAWDKKQKEQQIQEKEIDTTTKFNNISENKQSEKIDFNNIKEEEINKQTIISLMESVGMTNSSTHERMINHVKDKGAKDDIEIFESIKNMLYPVNSQNQMNNMLEQQMKFFSEHTQK